MQADNVCASAWLDRKRVTVMASGCYSTEVGTVLCTQKDGSRKEVSCPSACVKYNQYMGGVDCGNQLRVYYQYHLKCRRFYEYIANFSFQVSVTNSFILFMMKNQTKMCLKTFWETLALELIGDYCSRQRIGRGGGRYLPQLSVQHFPIKKLTSENGEKKESGKFSLCCSKKKRRDAPWYCSDCSIWLCHTGTRRSVEHGNRALTALG